jgi:hypothetical protein
MCTLGLFVILTTAAAAQQPNTLTAAEVSGGWILLFDGHSLSGWTPEGAAQWRVENGALVADAGGYGWLRSDGVYSVATSALPRTATRHFPSLRRDRRAACHRI